eukprot:GHVU01082460.1.p2 GENE.GHVU01082460.1~~GHVU01082460.1.p2  ORF type:complete len:239 (-),score=21.71 GHVU01082460.1:1247-1963(-)
MVWPTPEMFRHNITQIAPKIEGLFREARDDVYLVPTTAYAALPPPQQQPGAPLTGPAAAMSAGGAATQAGVPPPAVGADASLGGVGRSGGKIPPAGTAMPPLLGSVHNNATTGRPRPPAAAAAAAAYNAASTAGAYDAHQRYKSSDCFLFEVSAPASFNACLPHSLPASLAACLAPTHVLVDCTPPSCACMRVNVRLCACVQTLRASLRRCLTDCTLSRSASDAPGKTAFLAALQNKQ